MIKISRPTRPPLTITLAMVLLSIAFSYDRPLVLSLYHLDGVNLVEEAEYSNVAHKSNVPNRKKKEINYRATTSNPITYA